jgi:hypothetical protein
VLHGGVRLLPVACACQRGARPKVGG